MPLTISQLIAEIDAQLPTNNTGQITAATVRAILKDIVNNEYVPAGNILTSSGTASSSTFLRGDNTWATPAGGGGGTFTGTGDPGLSRAQHMATTYTTPPNAIRTTGYYNPGDGGGGLYIKKTAQPDHAGKFQTTDGTWYELVPENNQVSMKQFGAKEVVTAWNAKENDIGPACNAMVEYIVFSGYKVGEMVLDGGTYYMNTTCQLKGGSWNVRGAGQGATFIMTDEYKTGFVAHHPSYSFEEWGGVYQYRDWMVGETAFWGVLGTHAYICSVAGVTSSDGSQHPTGTANGQVDGTVTWNYYRESTRVERTTSYWGGEFYDVTFYSHYDGTTTNVAPPSFATPAPGPWDQRPSWSSSSAGPWKPTFGFLGRARANVHHCEFSGFSGCGVAFIANGDVDFPTVTGNVNYWSVTDCKMYYNAMDGLHVSHSDGNAGYGAHLDLAFNGRWGIRDLSFLGNCYNQCQSNQDGKPSQSWNQRFRPSVVSGGYYWFAKLGNVGAGPTPDYSITPGTSGAFWGGKNGDGTYGSDGWDFIPYNSAYPYQAAGAYGSDNINARNVWTSLYIEGGTFPAQFNGKDLVLGGMLNNSWLGGFGGARTDGAGAAMIWDGYWVTGGTPEAGGTPETLSTNTVSGNYTLVLSDGAKVVEENSGSANNVTVPPNSAVAFPNGTFIEISQIGTGLTTIVAGSGVTIHKPPSAAGLVSKGQWASMGLRKRNTDEWVASGDFA